MRLVDVHQQLGLGHIGKAAERALTLSVHVIFPSMHSDLVIRQAARPTNLAGVYCVLLWRLLLLLLQGHFRTT